VQPSLVAKLLADSGTDFLTTTSLGKSRVRREKESREAGSPPLSDRFVGVATGEAGLLLLVAGEGDGEARQAMKDLTKTWLIEERFPIEYGYRRSEVPLTMEFLASITAPIAAERAKILNGTTTASA
jgi:hypothetical protein